MRSAAMSDSGNPIEIQDVVSPVPGVVAEEAGEELVLYRGGTETTVYLNPSAAVIWRLLDGTRTGEAILDLLTEAYGEDEGPSAKDITDTLEEFIELGIAELR